MMLGGNDKLNAHFAKFGVKGSIVERYNSPAAALFRDTIIAMRDGTPVPTDIAPYEAEMAAEMAAKAARASETPAERDARTRAETQERMRAKFGADGLKNQSLGSSSLSGGESSSARSGGGGGAGSGGASFDDFFGVDFSAQCVPWGARECGHASQGSSPPVRLQNRGTFLARGVCRDQGHRGREGGLCAGRGGLTRAGAPRPGAAHRREGCGE